MVQAPYLEPVTLDEFLSWPEESAALELIDGVVERKPAGNLDHAAAQANLYDILRDYARSHGGRAFPELGRPFPGAGRGNHRVPDVSYFRSRDIARDSHRYPVETPALVAEVRSPGQSLRSLEARLLFLLGHGAEAGLLVDPVARSVVVYHPGGTATRYGPGEQVTLAGFDGLTFTVDQLFD
ncbi:MAG: Uma2 family endonuclease [Dehalococcoidia bacterium]|nr:Uma2 family endonuclease [Dehalococcoidia bacterium]